MALFLRITVIISIVSCLLVFISSAVGYVSDAIIVRLKLKVGEFTYVLHVEDKTHHIRLMLAGTRCYPALPDWGQPEAAPIPYMVSVLIDRGDLVLSELVQCNPV